MLLCALTPIVVSAVAYFAVVFGFTAEDDTTVASLVWVILMAFFVPLWAVGALLILLGRALILASVNRE